MNAIDTNVFVYALDDLDPAKQAKAQTLLSGLAHPPNSTIIPWQVASEFLNWLRRWENNGRITTANLIAHFGVILSSFSVSVPDERLFQRYFNLFERYSLSHWDAMLLAACQEAGVTTLYSEDLQAGMDYDGVVIVNPFV